MVFCYGDHLTEQKEADMSRVLKKRSVTLQSGKTVSIARKNYSSNILAKAGAISEGDLEMDYRAACAVSSAVKKASVLKAPIAKYDIQHKQAYLEYTDGRREIIE